LQPAAALRGLEMKLSKGPVLNFPVDDLGFDSALQTVHRQPIATGYLARYSAQEGDQVNFIKAMVSTMPRDFDAWYRASGFRTVVVGGAIPIAYHERLRKLSTNIVYLGDQESRVALAIFGGPLGTPDPQIHPSDRLEGIRRYDTTGGTVAKQIDLLADANDSYILEIFHGDRLIARFTVPKTVGEGLTWRAVELPPADVASQVIDRIEVRAGEGDGVYAVRTVVLGG
jgi:hypothetical protein